MKEVQCHKSMFFIYNSNYIRFKLYSNFQNSFKNRISVKPKLENYRTSLNETVSRRHVTVSFTNKLCDIDEFHMSLHLKYVLYTRYTS